MSRKKPTSTLHEALASTAWGVEPGRFALLGFPQAPLPEDLTALGEGPGQLIREGGETTLLTPQEGLAEALERHPAAQVAGDLAWIRFHQPMGWEVVGFLAHVTGGLAAAGVPLGAVCGFSRDHLFVADPHLPRAREVLTRLFGPEQVQSRRGRPAGESAAGP